MLYYLIINAALLIAAISIGIHALNETDLEQDFSMKHRILIGISCGFLGILLMVYSIKIDAAIIIDFRNIATILAATFAGFIPSLISGVIIGLFRIMYFGVNISSLIGLISAILVGLGSGYISTLTTSKKKIWLYSTVLTMILSTFAFVILLRNSSNLPYIFVFYIIGLSAISYFTFGYIDYLVKMNRMFRKYKYEATKDFLTDLNNVRQFDKVLNDTFDKIASSGEPMALLYLDIDYFKKINDTYGHLEGDNILRQIGNLLRKTCRSFDIISRIGGEEFSVMLLDCNTSRAMEVAERIRSSIEKNRFELSNGTVIPLTVSIGIATYPETTTDLNQVLEYADTALYTAKKSGRNRVVLYTSEIENICRI